MRKIIGLFMMFLMAAASPAAAQMRCRDAAHTAAPLLEEARVNIEAGDTDEALVLLQAAQALLESCGVQDTGETAAARTGDSVEADGTTPVTITPVASRAVVTPADVNLEQSVTFIAFAHTSVDSGPIDLYTGGSLVVANLNFGEATGLFPFAGGPRRFVARPAGSGAEGDVMYTVEWNYLANSSWIVTAAGLLDELSFIVEPVSIVRNDYNGRARVRVVNFVPERRVTVRDENGVEFGNGLGWIGIKDTMVDAGSYTLRVQGDGERLMEPVSVELDKETTYTFYVIGSPDHPVQLLPISAPQDRTRVRFVSQRGDTVDIHYRPTNNRIVERITGNETSDWIALASGAVTFIAYEPGTGPAGRELAALPLQLRPGRDVTIALNGRGFVVSEVVLTP